MVTTNFAEQIVEQALAFAGRGWAVFPLAPGTKLPLIAKEAGGHGCLDATRSAQQIRTWWAACPTANIGIATGQVSGFDVLDVDGPAGEASATRLAVEHGPFSATRRVRTRNGWHLYFDHKPGLKNRAAVLGKGSGLDVRTDGGYVVAPGSVVQGHTYALTDEPQSPWPDWLWALLPKKGEPKERRQKTPQPAHAPTGVYTRYGSKAADAEIARLRAAAPGTRNETLNAVAFNLGQLAGGGEIPDLADTLESVALEIGLDAAEARKTVRSGWAAGLAKPRQAPPRAPRGGREASRAAASRPPSEAPHEPSQGALDEDSGPGTEIGHPPPPSSTGNDGPDGGSARELHTDLGNARRLVRIHGKDLRHTSVHGWLVWDGTRWERDETREADRRAKNALESLWAEARRARDADAAKALAKHAIRSQAARAIEAALRLGATEPTVAARWSDFDAHPWLLNVRNGVLDLRSATLKPHAQDLFLTRRAEAAWNPDATCPLWTEFLEQVLPDRDVRAFVQRFAGYSLAGVRPEQVFAFLYGTGSNGKSTFLDVLASVLGDYGLITPFDTFLERQAGQATNDLARLAGARFVRASEPDEGAVLSESVVKQATGGEPITARYLRQEFFTFQPEFALWLSGNHQPRVRGTDHGLWRRVRLIPFTVRIEKGDPTLKEKLLAERDGILRWLVEGCQDWQDNGLEAPKAVLAATAGYRQEQDVVGQFIDECCELVPDTQLTAKALRRAYEAWCEDTGERPVSPRAFAGRLHERGVDRVHGRNGWSWTGLRLRDEARLRTNDLW